MYRPREGRRSSAKSMRTGEESAGGYAPRPSSPSRCWLDLRMRLWRFWVAVEGWRGLGLEVGEVGLAEGALDDVEVEL